MTVQPKGTFSLAKIGFLVLFVGLLLAWTVYDYRRGNSMWGPGILGAFVVAIAIIFKPWRTGSDEGPRPPYPPKPPSSYLLTPLLFQDSLPAATQQCDGMIDCHPWVVAIVALVVAACIYGIIRYNKAHP